MTHPRITLAVANFFGAAHFYLIVYIITTYLATFMPAEGTGLVVAAGALATIALFPLMPRIIERIGARKAAVRFAMLEALALTGLAIGPIPVFAVLLLALSCAVPPLISYGLDLLLEATVREEGGTGRIRTAFLSAGNVMLVIAPLITGYLLDSGNDYPRVFLAAAASLIPFMAVLLLYPPAEGQMVRTVRTRATLVEVFRSQDQRSVLFSYYFLQFYYYSAPLYVPLYLHNVAGIPWTELGWILSIVLIPFLLVEYPAGLIADRLLGDKELMATGFAIAGVATMFLALVTPLTPVVVIVAILAVTRVGVALVEAMVEGHFFRSVTERDADTVSVFRSARPLGSLTAPIASSIFLALGGYSWLFIGIGMAVLILGLVSVIGIKDVR